MSIERDPARVAGLRTARRLAAADSADEWDRAHEEFCAIPHGCPAHDNPFREEGRA